MLTLNISRISESCVEIKIKLNFYFHTSLWCLKVNFLSSSGIRTRRLKRPKRQHLFSSLWLNFCGCCGFLIIKTECNSWVVDLLEWNGKISVLYLSSFVKLLITFAAPPSSRRTLALISVTAFVLCIRPQG